MKGVGVGEFFSVLGGDVDGIEGCSLFGANARMDGSEVVIIHGTKDVVKESDAVEGLKFDDGEVGVEFVADKSADWKLDDLLGFWFEVVGFFAEVFGGVVVLDFVDLVE